jgi:hypothetical protein
MIKRILKLSAINVLILYSMTIMLSILYFLLYNPRPELDLKSTIWSGLWIINIFHFEFSNFIINIVLDVIIDLLIFSLILIMLIKLRINIVIAFLFFYIVKIIFIFYKFSS